MLGSGLRSLVDPILGAVAVVILRVEVVLRAFVPATAPTIRDRLVLCATGIGLRHFDPRFVLKVNRSFWLVNR